MGKIPDEWRAAIDKAVAEGRVTKISTGVSGIDLGQPNGWKEQRTAFFKARERMKNPAVTARRERVAALHAEGRTVNEIIAETGADPKAVYNDMHLLGLKANRKPPEPRAQPVAEDKRAATAGSAGRRTRPSSLSSIEE